MKVMNRPKIHGDGREYARDAYLKVQDYTQLAHQGPTLLCNMDDHDLRYGKGETELGR